MEQPQEKYLDLTEEQDNQDTGFDIGLDFDQERFEKALSFPTAEDFQEALGF